MRKGVRSVVLLAGALLSALAPCAPALAFAPACAMPGCEESSSTAIGSATCCCATGATPASMDGNPLSGSRPDRAAASVLQAAGAPGESAASAPASASPEPPAPVPLYLLNASLLI